MQAGGVTHGAVDVDGRSAGAADEVVVVVADAILVAGGGAGGLDATEKALLDERPERVVDGLARDRAERVAHALRDLIRRAMRLERDRAQHRETLGGHLHAVLAEKRGRIDAHGATVAKIWTLSRSGAHPQSSRWIALAAATIENRRMPHRRRVLALVCGLLILSGCAQQAADNFHAVRPGMTKAAVEDLLGRPSSTWTDDEGLERWHWGDSLSSLATSGVFREADTARVWVVWFDGEGLVRSSREPDWVRER